MNTKTFQRKIWAFYKASGRHSLPWRQTKDPYKILVSEMMLQQTQVDRVVPKYKSFLEKFPNTNALATSPLRDVLKEWQGLGYNRRAKFLWETARAITTIYRSSFPKTPIQMIELPGIGPYTASAVAVFAFDQPQILIETNIRTVYIHEFFPNKDDVSDAELLRLIKITLDTKNPRQWYWALMDYGAYLKKLHPNPSRRSTHHITQSKFKGSRRELRGLILRELSKEPKPLRYIEVVSSCPKTEIRSVLHDLVQERLIQKKGSKYLL